MRCAIFSAVGTKVIRRLLAGWAVMEKSASVTGAIAAQILHSVTEAFLEKRDENREGLKRME